MTMALMVMPRIAKTSTPIDSHSLFFRGDIMNKIKIPSNYPVKVLRANSKAKDRCTCMTCGRSWDDAIATSMTPTPSGRCPFEYFHG